MSKWMIQLCQFFYSELLGVRTLILLFLISITSWVSFHFRTISIATVDVTGIIREFVQTKAQLALSPEEVQREVHFFSHQLDTTLKKVAKEYRVILVLKEATITEASDLTPIVKKQLQMITPQNEKSKQIELIK